MNGRDHFHLVALWPDGESVLEVQWNVPPSSFALGTRAGRFQAPVYPVHARDAVLGASTARFVLAREVYYRRAYPDAPCGAPTFVECYS